MKERLANAGITHFKLADIKYVLHGTYAKGDLEKAYGLLVQVDQSDGGIIRPFNPDVKLLGAVNRFGCSCYLDTLLFAMFAQLESFEAILSNSFPDEPRKRLATTLRLWVNTLRAGKLITLDIVGVNSFIAPLPLFKFKLMVS